MLSKLRVVATWFFSMSMVHISATSMSTSKWDMDENPSTKSACALCHIQPWSLFARNGVRNNQLAFILILYIACSLWESYGTRNFIFCTTMKAFLGTFVATKKHLTIFVIIIIVVLLLPCSKNLDGRASFKELKNTCKQIFFALLIGRWKSHVARLGCLLCGKK